MYYIKAINIFLNKSKKVLIDVICKYQHIIVLHLVFTTYINLNGPVALFCKHCGQNMIQTKLKIFILKFNVFQERVKIWIEAFKCNKP